MLKFKKPVIGLPLKKKKLIFKQFPEGCYGFRRSSKKIEEDIQYLEKLVGAAKVRAQIQKPKPKTRKTRETKADRLARIAETAYFEDQEMRESGAIGFMARTFVQATMPHSKPKDIVFQRKNGSFALTMIGDPDFGLPYGSAPRLVMSWITTEAVRTKNPVLELGESLSGFMRELGLMPTGGKLGSIPRLKSQIERLFSCRVQIKQITEERTRMVKVDPIKEFDIWWDPKKPNQGSLFTSTVTLYQDFFEEIVNSPIVYRMDALKAIKQSSMAVDLYIWATYKNSYTKRNTYIPWELLQLQFGAGYPNTPQGKADFKRKFIVALKQVAAVYPEAAKLRPETENLIFVPGKPHVNKTKIYLPDTHK